MIPRPCIFQLLCKPEWYSNIPACSANSELTHIHVPGTLFFPAYINAPINMVLPFISDLSIVNKIKIYFPIFRLIAFESEKTYNPSRSGDRNNHTQLLQAERCSLSYIATFLKKCCPPRVQPQDSRMPEAPT